MNTDRVNGRTKRDGTYSVQKMTVGEFSPVISQFVHKVGGKATHKVALEYWDSGVLSTPVVLCDLIL